MEWTNLKTSVPNGVAVAYLTATQFKYTVGKGIGPMEAEPIPPGLTLDEQKAWALTIYRMAQ